MNGGWWLFYREASEDYFLVDCDRSEVVGHELVAAGFYGALTGLVGEADAQVGDGEGGAVAGAGVLGFGAEEVRPDEDGGQQQDDAESDQNKHG